MEKRKKIGFNPSWLLLAFALLLGFSCDDDNEGIKTFQVKIQLEYPEGYTAAADVNVKLTNAQSGAIVEKTTDATGTVAFTVTAGTYEVVASETRTVGLNIVVFNGIKNSLVVTVDETVLLPLSESKTNQLVIKELYNGGCQKNDASGAFSNDKYVILYNNSDVPAVLENLSLAILTPLNATSGNKDLKNESLFYEAEGWIPAGYAYWTLGKTVTVEPGKQIVIALNNAIDNTVTYSNSINFANPAYYATYDIATAYNNPASYSVSELIPTTNYLKAYIYGAGNAWPISQISPAFFVFTPKGISPADLATDVSYDDYYGDSQTAANHRKKIPVDWIVDGIEVTKKGDAGSYKRLTPAIDAGYVELTNQQGHTLYRNVDKTTTEAIAANAGKLVYTYTLGSDPSGIDAEASIKNGARIIYKDTNNSSNDFHERSRASLRD
ncbi:MAG: DUF4876 domain-containing protein [Candidatus Symbiothrix sp.]|jgi:hypothetical protein|nr:DUF4876 domain-containing protein [Candidatus Symbiothrix sp.]